LCNNFFIYRFALTIKNKENMFTLEELKAKAPSVFRTAEQGAKEGASDKYQFIPTLDVIDDLSKFGWNIHTVSQQNSRKSPDTTRHMVKFRHDSFSSINIGENIPEIVFMNSHDRTKSMQFHVGVFRMVCSNGLIVADKTFGKLNLRHMGYSFESVREMITDVTATLPNVFNNIKRFENTNLDEKAMREFAIQAFATRYPEYIKENGIVSRADVLSSVDVDKLLIATRPEDAPNNLWTTYNRVQEKLIGGQFQHIGNDNKVRQARPIKNISLNLSINEKLWEVAETFAQ